MRTLITYGGDDPASWFDMILPCLDDADVTVEFHSSTSKRDGEALYSVEGYLDQDMRHDVHEYQLVNDDREVLVEFMAEDVQSVHIH